MVITKFLIKFNVNSPNISLKKRENNDLQIWKFKEYAGCLQKYLRIQLIILCVNSLWWYVCWYD